VPLASRRPDDRTRAGRKLTLIPINVRSPHGAEADEQHR